MAPILHAVAQRVGCWLVPSSQCSHTDADSRFALESYGIRERLCWDGWELQLVRHSCRRPSQCTGCQPCVALDFVAL